MRKIIGFVFFIFFSCQNFKKQSCPPKLSVYEFKSYANPIKTYPNKKDSTNLKIKILGKYKISDSIYISPLKDAIIVLQNNQKIISGLTNNKGMKNIKIKSGWTYLKIKYYGYHSFSDSIKIEPDKTYNFQIILGAKNQ